MLYLMIIPAFFVGPLIGWLFFSCVPGMAFGLLSGRGMEQAMLIMHYLDRPAAIIGSILAAAVVGADAYAGTHEPKSPTEAGMPIKQGAEDALRKIIEQDDGGVVLSDLQQHDRHSGFAAGVRAMANIARDGLGRDRLPQTF